MQQQSLNGQWTLNRADQPGDRLAAQVPGCVHLDLLAAGQIVDPYFRDNESQLFWIGETDWTYRRTFAVSADLLAHECVLLRCHGLDTVGRVSLNGAEIGYFDNMYRTWEWDVKAHLRAGENEIEFAFEGPMTYACRLDAERGELAAWIGTTRLNSGGWIRKEPCNFGWDWGPKLVTTGIWRDLELVAFDTARLSDVRVLQDHETAGQVGLTVAGAVEQTSAAVLTISLRVSLDGQTAASADGVAVKNGGFSADLTIADPKLWWTNGLGDQPLYTVTVTLHGDQPLDSWTRRIGLRTLTLERHADEWGELFYFAINGVPFFAKGANWIPIDPFAPRITPTDYQGLIEAAVAANMNMLRVWGGGLYECDHFYDLCDEHGIALWQDFMFACGTYPASNDEFLASVEAEARDNVRRLRHHPSIALWCGNNELEQGMPSAEWKAVMGWDDYSRLFDHLLPSITAELDPQRAYWPGSPHKSLGERENWMNPDSGDSHLWAVWHGKEPYEWYRTRPDRFVSEFGFQSFPEPRVVEGFTLPEDRNITSYVMEYHQRSGIGNSTIVHYMLDWFRLPTSFEATIWLSQILQALAMQYAVEHWRRNMPRTMGAIYWQLNDCWPAPSWASLDYQYHWKALHYMARRFFAPLMISGVEDIERGTVALYVNNDHLQPVDAVVRWSATTVAGEVAAQGEQAISAAPNGSTLVKTVDFSAQLAQYTARDLIVWLALEVNGETVSENHVLFARPKHLELQAPQIDVQITPKSDQQFTVTLKAPQPALFVWLTTTEAEAQYSDSFFDLLPGQARTITVTTDAPLSADLLRAQLKVWSLTDTYQ